MKKIDKGVKRNFSCDNQQVKDYTDFIVKLSKFNVGGVPLHLLVCSSWFTPSNCELLSMWFSKVIPNGNYIEGSTEFYRKLANENNGKPYKWNGFHVWIEYFDEKTKTEKVLDPCIMSVFDKKYYYESESAVVKRIIPCNKVKCYRNLEPTTNCLLDEFDEYRLSFLFNIIGNFTHTDFGRFKNTIAQWSDRFEDNNKLQDKSKEFEEIYATPNNLELQDVVFELFTDKNKWNGKRFEEQKVLLSQLIDRMNDIQARGYVSENGNFYYPDAETEKIDMAEPKKD